MGTSFIFHPLQETQTSKLLRHSLGVHPLRCTNERIMRDIPNFQPLQETPTSELRETSFILHPLRGTNERIMRDIPHFSSPKRHKRANYARHSSFFIPQETQTSELCETFLIFLPLENWFWQNQTGG